MKKQQRDITKTERETLLKRLRYYGKNAKLDNNKSGAEVPPQEVPPMSAKTTTPTSSATAALSAYNAAYASSYAQRYAQLGKSTLDRDRNHFSSGIKTSKKSCLGPRRFF